MYTSDTSDIWIARSVKHEKKTELQVSLTPKKGPHTLYSVKYKSPQGIIKAKEHEPARTLYRQERKRKTNIKIVCYVLHQKVILPWFKFIFLLPGNGKDYENEFKLQKKKYTEISATLPSPQKTSILKTTVYVVF